MLLKSKFFMIIWVGFLKSETFIFQTKNGCSIFCEKMKEYDPEHLGKVLCLRMVVIIRYVIAVEFVVSAIYMPITI